MTVFDDGKNLVGGLKKGGKKKKRAQRQKRKIKAAKKSGNDAEAKRLKDKRKKTKQQIHKADKQAARGGVAVGTRFAKAGSAAASGNRVGAVAEFF